MRGFEEAADSKRWLDDVCASSPLFLALPLVALLALLPAACGGPGQADGGVELVKGERSTPAYSEATLSIDQPKEGVVYPDSAPRVHLELSDMELGVPTPGADDREIAMSAKGQHVHLIVDNLPYQAVYDVSGLVELATPPLDSGIHVLRAFPSRQWHESVKSQGAFAMTHFFLGDTTRQGVRTQLPYVPGEPVLTYSRPKGTYEGAGADSVMVDFWLQGAELGPDDHKVRLVVDDTLTWTLEEWVPHYLLGLSDGEHEVSLQLLAPDLTPVPGAFNQTSRSISVVRPSPGGAADGESQR